VEINLELSTNPSILFNKSLSAKNLSLFNIYLGDSGNKISRTELITTSMEPLPPNATLQSWRDDKTFYTMNDVEVEYLLNNRIEAVLNTGGWLHRRDGGKFRIKDNKVVEFAIHGDLLNFYKKISKREIEVKFGKADKIQEVWENYDGTLFTTEYIYFSRRLRIHYQDWDKVIDGINIGDSLSKQ
jgi:hypothetical protein